MINSSDISPETKSKYSNTVSARITSVRKMLDQLFEFARIEGSEYSLDMQSVNINNVLRDKISLFYDDFISRDIEPVLEILTQLVISC